MKKITLLSAVILLFAMNCLAQNKGYLGVVPGIGIPVGDFGSTDMKNEHAGYAKVGPNFDVSYAQKFGKYLGISALLRFAALPNDTETIKRQFEQQYPGVNFGINDDSWTTIYVMGGGYGSFPISSKVSFEARAMAGVLNVASPEMAITLNGPDGSAWVRQESKTTTALSFLIGAGFKFNVGKRVCLLANLDYTASNADFKDVKVSSSDGTTNHNDISQSINTFNIGFGVGYRL